MQTTSRLLDDLAKVASGAASTLAGIKQELDALVRQRIERFLADLDVVSRDEFDAVKEVAANARAEQERLEARVAALEAQLGLKAAARPRAARAKPARAKAKARSGESESGTGPDAGDRE